MSEYDPAGPVPASSGEFSSGQGSGQPPAPGGWRGLMRTRKRLVIGVTVLACAAAGVSIGVAASGSSTSTSATASAPAANGGPFGGRVGAGAGGAGGGSNARSGPEPGGSSGTVTGVSASGFTFTTPTGQTVTVNETSSTTYQDSTGASASASAVTTGEPVLVLGTVNSTTITAAQVTVEPAGNPYTAVSSQVVPFQQGTTSQSKQIGQIPANYTQGQGTIVTGSTAYQAAQAALAAYPGGIVDRVVQLSGGEYEVHIIGLNWPHHAFVNQSFQVVGAN